MVLITKKEVFYPYSYLNSQIELTISSFLLDHKEKMEFVDKDNFTIDLTDQNWDKAAIKLSIELDGNWINDVFPFPESYSPGYEALIIYSCKEAKWRKFIKMQAVEGNTKWEGELKIDKKDISNEVQFSFVIVRSADSPDPVSGYAKRMGEKILSSNEWKLVIYKSSAIPGQHLHIEWENFSQSRNKIRKKYKNEMYYLDFEGDAPKLYLNEGIPNLKVYFENKSHYGKVSAIRDAIFNNISQSIWQALILSSSIGIKKAEELSDWQKAVLLQFVHKVIDNSENEKILDEFLSRINDYQRFAEIFSHLQLVISQKINTEKAISSLLNITWTE
ncbi:MAG: hypothetical protein HF312_13380 [Ignavibacteria bacterium]|jgi:hypothetical protein|nr:hypothetical protein [Ignavibacteria bacterium]MCU7521206.1 hypothetical protein [Ignavibacteria bacterium]